MGLLMSNLLDDGFLGRGRGRGLSTLDDDIDVIYNDSSMTRAGGEEGFPREDEDSLNGDDDDIDDNIISPWCCWMAAVVCLAVGVVCFIVVGSILASDANATNDEVEVMVYLLIGLGGVPCGIFLLFCAMGAGLFLQRRYQRNSQANLAREIERMVPADSGHLDGLPVTME